jgi:hypothetical protein
MITNVRKEREHDFPEERLRLGAGEERGADGEVAERAAQKCAVASAPVILVVDPTSANRLLAAAETRILVSQDSGQTWTTRERGTGLLAWPRRDHVYLLDADGRVWLSGDGGTRSPRCGHIGGRPAALYPP